ncbi:hypothetical protein OS493_009663 [Desmophyllum pertusum]|uniref:Uncharacterized protein n=1 Tax=Desmophyllum pertusum TaxID=174260 RepID=A0A9W9YR93_9CNID|nr:hypothetical protein OS493_009663 [Desmophyllum pertusum]
MPPWSSPSQYGSVELPLLRYHSFSISLSFSTILGRSGLEQAVFAVHTLHVSQLRWINCLICMAGQSISILIALLSIFILHRSFEVELRQCQRELETKESEIEELKKRSSEEELRLCKIDLETKKREIESLKKRMAQYGDRRTRQDQRDVEDTLSLNRQSKVEQDFKDFVSEDRIDACIKITEEYKEKSDINAKRLTCMVFETVYEYVLATKGDMTNAFKEISKFVVENGPGIGHHYFERLKTRKEPVFNIKIPLRSSGSEYSRDVLDGLLLSVKESAPKVNTDIFMKGIKDKILRLAQERMGKRSCKLMPTMWLLNHLDDYLKECIKLKWRMVKS